MRLPRTLSCWCASSVELVLGSFISSEFVHTALKIAMLITVNVRYYLTVPNTLWQWFFGVFRSARTEMWSEILSDDKMNRTLFGENHKIKRMTMNVGMEVDMLMQIERLENNSELTNIRRRGSMLKLKFLLSTRS